MPAVANNKTISHLSSRLHVWWSSRKIANYSTTINIFYITAMFTYWLTFFVYDDAVFFFSESKHLCLCDGSYRM